MNKVFLIGRLTKDSELRYTSNNVPCCTFTLAVDRQYTNQDGTKETDFLNIVVWKKPAENCHKYLAKGSQVAIEGRIQIRSYDNEKGEKRYVTEVVAENVQFLDTKKAEEPSPEKPEHLTKPYKPEEVDPYAEFGKQVEAEFKDEEEYPWEE